jgi:hypothetical protein
MKADDPFPARITSLLMPLGPVRARSMFGGCGIFLDDLMFALIAWDRLYFKVDDETNGGDARRSRRPHRMGRACPGRRPASTKEKDPQAQGLNPLGRVKV